MIWIWLSSSLYLASLYSVEIRYFAVVSENEDLCFKERETKTHLFKVESWNHLSLFLCFSQCLVLGLLLLLHYLTSFPTIINSSLPQQQQHILVFLFSIKHTPKAAWSRTRLTMTDVYTNKTKVFISSSQTSLLQFFYFFINSTF